jgi:uncharacterized cupin superfamily protein
MARSLGARSEDRMDPKPAKVIRAADIQRDRAAYTQRLNPRSRFEGTELAHPGGLQRVGVSIAWLRPGSESFAFHAHMVEEEWIYALSGRAMVDIGNESVEIGPGDFIAFPAPNQPHLVRNPFEVEFSYLMGGQIGLPLDLIDYPRLGKQYLLKRDPGQRTSFHSIGTAEHLFGSANDKPR